MKGEENLFSPRIYTEQEIREKWPGGEMRNDRIKVASLEYALVAGGIVGLCIVPERFCGCFCSGYVSTGNVGFIVKTLIQVLDVDAYQCQNSNNDHFDILATLKGVPFRVYNWGHAGDSVMRTVCIGNFMDDRRFVYGADLMKCGLPKAVALGALDAEEVCA